MATTKAEPKGALLSDGNSECLWDYMLRCSSKKTAPPSPKRLPVGMQQGAAATALICPAPPASGHNALAKHTEIKLIVTFNRSLL